MPENIVRFANGEQSKVIPDKFPEGMFNSPESLLTYYQEKAQKLGTKVELLDVEGFPRYEHQIDPLAKAGITGPPEEGLKNKIANFVANQGISALQGPPMPGDMAESPLSAFQQPKVSAPALRAATEIAGEVPAMFGAEQGFKIGLSRGRPLLGTAAGAAIAGLAGNQGMDWLQEKMGLEPKRENPVWVAIREPLAELTGRRIFGTLPALYRRFRAFGQKVDPKAVASEIADYNQLNIKPMVAQVLGRGGIGDSVTGWMAKNPFTSGKLHDILDKQYRQAVESVTSGLLLPATRELPTGTTTGAAIQRGLERFDDDFIKKSSLLYEDVWSKIDENAPIPWKSSREFFQEAGSTNPLYRHFGSPKVRALAQEFEGQFVKKYQKELPGGGLALLEKVDNVDLETMRNIRTLVGEAIRDWTPGADYKIKEMQKLYGALSDDIRSGVKLRGQEGALESFDAANAYWNKHMSKQETIMKTIENAMGQDPKKLWDHVSSLTNRGYETTLKELRSRLGPGSEEWDRFRKMIIRENLITGSRITDKNPRGLFPEKFVEFRDKIDSDEVADMIFGSPGTKMRKKYDAIYDISVKLDSVLKAQEKNPFTRFTSAEALGPLAMGGFVGVGTYTSSEGDTSSTVRNVGLALLGGVGLSAISSRSALRLLSSDEFATTLARALQEPSSSLPANLTRLGGTVATMDAEEKEAMIEWLAAVSEISRPGGQQQQGDRVSMNDMQMQNMRSGLATLPGVRVGGS
jgi:hypothetical protein